jgi:hypothetical protein
MIKNPVVETVEKCLGSNAIPEIDGGVSDKISGWTSFDNPFKPEFYGSCFVYGPYFIFSLRIDKKVLPQKVVQKHIALETAKRLAKSGKDDLSANEKAMIKDHVLNILNIRIPATPNIYDVVWLYETSSIWFFSNLKSANEELETLFIKSFNLALTRLFPYTTADLDMALSDSQKDELLKLTPTTFTA